MFNFFKKLIIIGALLSPTSAFTQCIVINPTETQVLNTIASCLPTTNANQISALALRQTLDTMTSAIFTLNSNILNGPNTWTALQTFSSGATVPTLTFGNSSTNAASTAFVQSAAGTSVNVLYATNYAGATAGDQISACVAALPAFGGICDARGIPSGSTIPAITLAQSGATVLGPCGRVTVTGSIQVFNVQGFNWNGCGADLSLSATSFIWQGNSSDPLFRIRGVRDSEFANFGIASSIAFPLATAIRMETATGTTSTSRIFRNIKINGTNSASAGLTKGMQWCTGDNCGGAGGDANNDLDYVENVTVANYFNTAFSIEATQSKTITFQNSQFVTGQRGVSTTQGAIAAGSFRWYGGGGGSNSVADFDVGSPTDDIIIIGCNTEGSNRLLNQPNATSAGYPVTIQGCRWAANSLNADNFVVNYSSRGSLNLIGNFFDGPATGLTPKFLINTGGSPARGNAIGNTIGWATSISASSMPFVCFAPGAIGCWNTSGNILTNASNVAQFSIYDLIAPNPLTVATLPTCNTTTQGNRQFVTDQNTAVSYRGAITGSGSTSQSVFCDGTNWLQD